MRPFPAGLRAALPGLVAVVLVAGVTSAVALQPRPPAPVQRVQQQADATRVVTAQASRTRPLRTVAPLRTVLVPDLVVKASAPLTAAQLVALRGIRRMAGVTVVATGRVHGLDTMAVDPSSFRSFTPRETARSDALWAAVARGDLAPAYSARLALGQQVPLRPGLTRRVGAVAAYGLPDADLVLDASLGTALGLRRDTAVVTAPKRSVTGLKRDIRAALGRHVTITVLRPVPISYRRPATYRALYIQSARYCPGLSWRVLAAIGQVESGHGRNVGPSSAGALGPMQFLPSTWAWAGVDGDGDGRADILSAYDAVPAAALYLCRAGAGRGGQSLYDAIYSYNHADWYVKQVLDLAARYR